MTGAWTIRPMRAAEVPSVERLTAQTYLELDLRTRQQDEPAPRSRPTDRSRSWVARTQHLVDTDPGGCWVAHGPDGLEGAVVSYRRELMWCLATYAVRPGLQDRGLGRQLLEAALSHGRGCLRAMISSSADPRAARRYQQAGFTLHPMMLLRGAVDRSAIPVDDLGLTRVREGTSADRELLDSLDRRTRGAAHGDLHDVLGASSRLLVCDTSTGSGYAYVDDRAVLLLAATNRRTAARLAWVALADAPGEVEVAHVTAANPWLVDVGMAARLQLHQAGYLALRGMRTPAPYVHHGALL